MKSRTIRKTIIIFAVIVLICLLSNGTGYYYPLAGKKDATQYYALEKHNQAIISWNHSNLGISNVSFDRSYQRIANILVIDGGTLIGIGFGKLAICIDSENKDHEYVSLFWRDNAKQKVSYNSIKEVPR